MATLTTGSVNFGEDVFLNHPRDIEFFARQMQEYGVKPELEVFDTGMIATAAQLMKKGIVLSPPHFDLVMGVPGGIAGTPDNLLTLVRALPADATWTVAGIGKAELPLGVMGIILGGHVRVGFEDNIYYSRGVLAKSNAQLVARIAGISRELGREVARPDEARSILGLASHRA
jgi:3-keto-5-aminohexanoate cleavage enzyme